MSKLIHASTGQPLFTEGRKLGHKVQRGAYCAESRNAIFDIGNGQIAKLGIDNYSEQFFDLPMNCQMTSNIVFYIASLTYSCRIPNDGKYVLN